MDRSRWYTELATAVTELHSPRFVYSKENVEYENKSHRRQKLSNRIFDAVRRLYDLEVRRVLIFLSFKYPWLHNRREPELCFI
jgi:hypothetical protein